MKSRAKTPPKLDLPLTPAQCQILYSRASEIWYGGAAGGGKSHLVRVVAILLCVSIPNFNCFLFRRKRIDLMNTHMKGPQRFAVLLEPLIRAKLCRIVKDEIRFWNGSSILLCHCKDEKDVENYLSTEMHALLIDEASAFTEEMYRFLRSRTRVAGLDVPQEWQGRLPFILLSSNPGGLLHRYLKENFYDPQPPKTQWTAPDDDGGMLRQFVPALLSDNPHIDQQQYRRTLEGLGSEALVKMYRDGDMNVVLGAYFDIFSQDHICRTFSIPSWWTRFRAVDWGFDHHTCCLWYAVSDGSIPGIDEGTLIVYREYYERRKTPDLLAQDIARLSQGENIAYTVGGRDMFADGKRMELKGPTIAETFANNGVPIIRAQDSRVQGWQECYRRLRTHTQLIFETCRNLIAFIPLAEHDEKKPEDVLKVTGDDAIDAWRYGNMSRPYASHQEVAGEPVSERFTTDVSGNVTYEFEDDLTTNDEATL